MLPIAVVTPLMWLILTLLPSTQLGSLPKHHHVPRTRQLCTWWPALGVRRLLSHTVEAIQRNEDSFLVLALWQVMDARPAGRFLGEAPEPRPNLPSGHIPGSINVPFASVLEDGR